MIEVRPGHYGLLGTCRFDLGQSHTSYASLKVFIATLGWSRATYVEFCDDERVACGWSGPAPGLDGSPLPVAS
jgi:hypothetical protein